MNLATLRGVIKDEVLRDTSAKWSDAQLNDFINDAVRSSWPHAFVRQTTPMSSDYRTVLMSTSTAAGLASVSGVEVAREYNLPTTLTGGAAGQYSLRCPVYLAEFGPVGGQQQSDSKVWTEAWWPLTSKFAGQILWQVDLSRGIIRFHCTPPYDTGNTYYYYWRLHYVRPIATLSSDTDTLEGPPGMIEFVKQYCRETAIQSLNRKALSNPERMQNQMLVIRDAEGRIDQPVLRRIRMQWPRVRNGELV